MNKNSIDIQGHRGCRGLMPENTIPAMLKAIDIGVKTLEMDVVISKDLKVVVSHDTFMAAEFMKKTDGSTISKKEEGLLNLYHMSYDSIATYDAGSKTYPRFPYQEKINVSKPLLSSLIDSVENDIKDKKLRPIFYNIEIKSDPLGDDVYHPKPEIFVDLLTSLIKEKGIRERVTIQSFDQRPLQILKKKHPEYKLALLVENTLNFDENLKLLGFNPDIYSPEYLLVNPEMIKAAHMQGIQIIPWTVNDVADMEKLVKMGVDGIISDYPDKAVQLFGRYN